MLGENGYKRCDCYELDRVKKLWINSGINPDQSNLTFKNYIEKNRATKETKLLAMNYLHEFENNRHKRNNSICFLGQVGSGKTHLSVAIALNLLKSKHIQVKYMPYRDIITTIKMSMKDEATYHKILTPYAQAKVLLIDDLFKGKINDSDINIMFEIINYRYLNYLPMIISSEFTTERLLDFDEAIGSRIIQMCEGFVIEIEGQENNYRLGK